MNKRIFVILLTAILLVVATFPVNAQAQSIPINGTVYIAGWCDDVTIPCDPKFRVWETRLGGGGWRNAPWLLYLDAGEDSPLTGYIVASDNWNIFHNGPYCCRNWGQGYSSDANWNPTDLWDVTSAGGHTDWEGYQTVDVIYKGRGINQGLLAKMTWSSTPVGGVYGVVGELLIPGN